MADVQSDLSLGMPRKTHSVWFQGPGGPGKPQACPWPESDDLLIQRAIQSHNAIRTWTTSYFREAAVPDSSLGVPGLRKGLLTLR